MTKLNQMVAVRKGLRARTERAVTDIYKQFQKPPLYAGLTRTYQPRDEEGEQLPSERQVVQRNVELDLIKAAEALTKLFDVAYTVDNTNMNAEGDVIVDGTLITSAPVPFLLFLEKQVTDFRTMVAKLPELDPETTWTPDPNNGGHRSEDVTTTRTRKSPRVLLRAPATERHPAQTEVYMVDEVVGDWTLTRFSGAVPATRKVQILARCDALVDAIRTAVEEANQEDVTDVFVGSKVFNYLLAP